MGFYTSIRLKSILEAGEGDVTIPLDTEDFHDIDPLEDHVGDAAGELDPDPIIGVGESYRIMTECEYTWNAIMQEVGIRELQYYAKNNKEMIYEAVDIKGFFAKAKQMFIDLLKKVAGVVKTFLAQIQRTFGTAGAFVKTNKDKITKGYSKINDSDFEMKGYKFTNTNAAPDFTSSLDDLKVDIKEITSEIDKITADYTPMAGSEYQDAMSELRGDILNQSSISAEDYAGEIFKFFRNGSKEKVDLKKTDFAPGEVINVLTGYEKVRKAAKDGYRKFEKIINDNIRKLNELERKLGKLDSEKDAAKSTKMSAVSHAIIATKDSLNNAHAAYIGFLAAQRAEMHQAKAVAMKYIAAANKFEKPESQNASTIFSGVSIV